MLIQTGALGWIYRDSFVAPYLQAVGDPIYENVILPINKHAVQPILGVLKQISDALAEYVLRPLQKNVFEPLFENVLKPLFDVIQGLKDAAKNVLKSALEPIFGSGGETSSAASEGAAEETPGEGASTPLVDEIEHTEL